MKAKVPRPVPVSPEHSSAAPRATQGASPLSEPPLPEPPSLQSRQETAERFGHHLESIPVSSPRGGQSLPVAVRSRMERAFNTHLSDVRIHESALPARLSARAVTQGADIHFAPGRYDPDSTQGLRLLGHELTHVLQQRAGRVAPGLNREPSLEGEASRLGTQAALGQPVSVSPLAPGLSPQAAGAGVPSLQCSDSESESSSEEEESESESSSEEEESESESSSEEEEEDGEYIEPVRNKGKKTNDPKARMKGLATVSTTGNLRKRTYSTHSGVKHEEEVDLSTGKSTTVSENLRLNTQYRNNAMRPKTGYRVYNHYNQSVGQIGRNQAVGSHRTPSWLGMMAGGEFDNMDMTSADYNSQVERAEKPWRENREVVDPTDKGMKYETTTEVEKIKDNPRADEIHDSLQKGAYHNPKWNQARIEQRLTNMTVLDPNVTRITSQQRKLTPSKGKKSRSKTLGVDLLKGIPVRAFDKQAHEKYKKARGEDSAGSDDELKEKRPKKKVKTS